MSSASTPSPFSVEFVSANQAITAAGSLTIAHGLGVIPKMCGYEIINQVADGGYSPGDIVEMRTWDFSETANAVAGLSNTKDATNLNIRFGSRTTWDIPNKGTGAGVNIVLANWNIRFKAWA